MSVNWSICVCVRAHTRAHAGAHDYLKLQMLDLHIPGALENNPKIPLYTLRAYPWGPRP